MAALNLFLILALAALVIGQQRQMVRSTFNATAYNEFMECVKNVSTRYDVAIDSGTVVIIPPQGGTIDLDSNADNALESCMVRFSSYLALAVDDSRFHVDNDGSVAMTQALATAEWAVSNGAQGMTLRNSTQVYARGVDLGAPGSAALLPRQVAKNYYFSLGSSYDDCSNYDQQNNVLNECITFGSPYRSITFSNPNTINAIRVRRWPHHKCAVDYTPSGKDGRSVIVYAMADCDCFNKPKSTFSWLGKLVPASCVGSCS